MTPSTCPAPHHHLSDAALAERAGDGDESAFEALDRRHRPALLRHCNRILRNSHDAEEAVQGVLLTAYRVFSSGRQPASVLPWLMVMARNECFDILRARRSTEELPLDIESSAIRPDELVMRREDVRVLRADLEELPQGQRAALVLRSMGDLPHGEIARLLGGTAAEARSLCHEARLSLIECEEGRNLECSEIRERIGAGDGRALRARRVRAHLRVCDGCRDAAGRTRASRRSGLGLLFPFPWPAGLRSLLFGGGASGAIGGVGSVAVVTLPIAAVVAALAVGVSVHGGGPARVSVPIPPAATPAARDASPSATVTTPTPARSLSPAARAGTSSPTPIIALQTPGVPASPAGAAAPSVQVPSVQVPSVQVPSVGASARGVTVSGARLSLPVISAQAPAVGISGGGVSVSGVQVPAASAGPVAGELAAVSSPAPGP